MCVSWTWTLVPTSNISILYTISAFHRQNHSTQTCNTYILRLQSGCSLWPCRHSCHPPPKKYLEDYIPALCCSSYFLLTSLLPSFWISDHSACRLSKTKKSTALIMGSYASQFCLTFTLSLFCLPAYSIKIWASPGDLPTAIPVSCRNALSQNITCSPDLVSARSIAAGRGLDVITLKSYCTPDCYNSLQVNAKLFHFARLGTTPAHAYDWKRPSKPPWTLAAEPLSIKCSSTVPYNSPEHQLQILWHGPTASRASRISKAYLTFCILPEATKRRCSLTAQAFAFRRFTMEQKLHAQTAHISMALQCSAQTMAEPSFSQRHSHHYCHPAAFQQQSTHTHTRLPQLRVQQRNDLCPIVPL